MKGSCFSAFQSHKINSLEAGKNQIAKKTKREKHRDTPTEIAREEQILRDKKKNEAQKTQRMNNIKRKRQSIWKELDNKKDNKKVGQPDRRCFCPHDHCSLLLSFDSRQNKSYILV